MKTYDDYIRALDQLLQKAALIPRGEWPNIPRPRLSKDAPRVLIFSPHPDDEVIISHLPLRLMRESKMQISNVAVTLGSKKGRRKSRLKELRNSCQFIGFDLVSLGIISILSSSILLIANLTDLIIEFPISEYSPLNGTINPILILSDEKAL